MMIKMQLLLGAALILAFLYTGASWIKARFYIDHMERNERLEIIQVSRVVETLKLKGSEKIADIGAGSGLFTRAMAKELHRGMVYAVDINSNLLDHIARTTHKAGISNVTTVLATEGDPNLPEPVDLVFICDTLHYIDNPGRYLKYLYGYVTDLGRVVIINFHQNWPPMSNKFSREELETWMDQAGFLLKEQHSFLQDRYMLVFARQNT